MVIELYIIIKMDRFANDDHIYKRYFPLTWSWEINLKSNLMKK